MKAMGQNKKSRVDNRKASAITSKRASTEASAETGKQPISPKEMAKARYALSFPDTEEIRKAFEILKARLSSAPVLMHPDFEREFILYTNACRKGIGAGLYQVSLEDNKLHPILFISRQLKDAEIRYSATELECLGLVWSLHKLQHYVDGAKLKIYTDHAALKWIWNVKATVNSRLFHWALLLNPLRDKITIIHRPGRFHTNADALSRFPSPSSSSSTSSSSCSSFNVNLVHIDNDWQEELWKGYINDRHFKNIVLRLVRIRNASTNGRNSTNPKATHTTTSISTADPSTPTPTPTEDGEKTLAEYAESTAKRSVTSTDGTFTLIGKSLYFSDRHTLRLCIPEKLILETLRLCHDVCGHPGVRRIYLSASK